jgi:mRNA-degrading endonuclease RelE of RelBE toxin-antitoxin system
MFTIEIKRRALRKLTELEGKRRKIVSILKILQKSGCMQT